MRYFIIFAVVLISVAVATAASKKTLLLGRPLSSPDSKTSGNQQSGENSDDDASTAGKGECTMNQGAASGASNEDKSNENQSESGTEQPKDAGASGTGGSGASASSKKNSKRY